MADFFRFQRVRKVRGADNIGMEATVYAVGVFTHNEHGKRLSKPATIAVYFDRPWANRFGHVRPASVLGYGDADHFDPIVPEGLESREEIEALNQPAPVEALENLSMRRTLAAFAEAAWCATTEQQP